MPLDPVFLDTWALNALANSKDRWHERAVEISKQLHAAGRPLVTTQWVLSEFLAFLARPASRDAAVRMVDGLISSPRTEIVPAAAEQWENGFALYRDRLDKGWSLVDCVSILTCQNAGIDEVFTADQHFVQAGLRILVPPES